VITQRKARVGVQDPWDARTLEWTTSSPPPEYNFEEIPTVHALDDFWHRKYAEDKSGKLVPVQAGAADHDAAAEDGGGHGIHMPGPSYWPIVVAAGFPLLGYGVIFHWWMAFLGAAILLVGLYGWVLEPSAE
jgi:cytochrome c oxidase subunit I